MIRQSVPVLIHIGYHKTGSSYLQSEFFTSQLGFSRWPPNQRAIHPRLVDLGPYDYPSESVVLELSELRRKAEEDGLQFVLSHERLSGHPSSGGYDSKALADRLKSVFADAKVLIVIREQEAMIRSAYSQFVTEGGSLGLKKYLADPEAPVRKAPVFSPRHFEYAPAIAYYQELFGVNNVLALPYEFFAKEPVSFLNRIGQFSQAHWTDLNPTAFANRKVNRRRKVLVQTFRRWLNAVISRKQFSNSGIVNLPKVIRLYEKVSGRMDWIIPESVDQLAVRKQKDLIRQHLGDYYRAFNRRNSDLVGFDLGEFGYQL